MFETGLNDQDLLGDSGQHSLFESVELVKAAPSADLAKTDKDPAHSIAIERLVTVENKNVPSKLRAQSLH